MDGIEVPREEYASLQKRPTVEEFTAVKERVEKAEAEKAEAEKAVETAEAAQKKAEEEKEAADKKVKDFEEKERQGTLASDRLGKLGKGFAGAMGEKTSERVKADAATMSDEAWEERVAELEETLDKKRDDGTEPSGGESTASGDTFTSEEVHASAVGSSRSGGDSNGGEPSGEARSAVMGGLLGSVSGGSSKSDK